MVFPGALQRADFPQDGLKLPLQARQLHPVEDVPLPVGEAVHGLLEGDVLQPALVGIL